MPFDTPVLLTADGMQQLQIDLQAFRDRHAALAETMAASPEDADSGTLTELALAQRRVAEIEGMLSRAALLDSSTREPGVVGVGSTVTVHWDGDGEETYTIVDPVEVDLDGGRISDESPVGQALMGRRAGDRVVVTTLAGSAWLAILSVD